MALPDVLSIERAGLKAWPGIDVGWDGSWVRRSANGYTKRANSFQSLNPDDAQNARKRILASAQWLTERGVSAVARITPLTPPSVVEELDGLGWTTIEPSTVLAMVLEPVAPDARGTLHALNDPRFLSAQQSLARLSDATLAKLKALLAVMDVPATGIVLHSAEGKPVASALMAVADGIVVTGNVVTDPDERRKGYGAAMMRTGLAWAHAKGARFAALNMVAGNDPARALYTRLGYRPQYDYSYRIQGAP